MSILRLLGLRVYQAISGVFYVLSGIVRSLSLIAVLLRIHAAVPLIMAATLLPHVLIRNRLMPVLWQGLVSRAPEERRLGYIRDLLLDDRQAKEVRFLGVVPYLREQYKDLFKRILAIQYGVFRKETLSRFGISFVSWCGTVAAVVLGVVSISRGTATVGDIAVLFSAVSQLGSEVSLLSNNIGSMMENSIYMRQLRSFLRLVEASKEKNGTIAVSQIDTVELQDVSFLYPGSARLALERVNLKISKGEVMAVVGANGAGKTTLSRLVLGLYRPTSGRVLVNGRDLKDVEINSVRARMSCMFQDFGRYSLTLRENVGFGDIGRLSDDRALVDALVRAEAGKLLEHLEAGIDTQMGKRFGGEELSGGEWQRVALARALIRDADLLVLDEPSAMLDAETEYQLYLKFKEMVRGKACILITHRFTTVMMADRIVVLSEGRIGKKVRTGNSCSWVESTAGCTTSKRIATRKRNRGPGRKWPATTPGVVRR